MNEIKTAKRKEEEDYDECKIVTLFNEYLEYNLKDCLEKNILNNTLKTRIALEVSFGMLHLHRLNIVHRNFNVENVMLNCIFEAKIINVKKSQPVFKSIYLAPEIECENDFSFKSDVYSFGVFLFVLFSGVEPEKGMNCNVIHGLSLSCSSFLMELIKKCTDLDREKRPSFDEIIDMMNQNSFALADDVDFNTVSRRYQLLDYFTNEDIK